MSLRVSFDLEESDLKHFRLIMREARNAAAHSSTEEIVAGAKNRLAQVGTDQVPQFIQERLANLDLMIRMLADHEWRLPKQESARVLNALAYFSEPNDLIPDHIPGLGFLDDAIYVELILRELKNEIDHYEEFCIFRSNEERKRVEKGEDPQVGREEWLKDKRAALHSRMRRYRRRRMGDVSSSWRFRW